MSDLNDKDLPRKTLQIWYPYTVETNPAPVDMVSISFLTKFYKNPWWFFCRRIPSTHHRCAFSAFMASWLTPELRAKNINSIINHFLCTRVVVGCADEIPYEQQHNA